MAVVHIDTDSSILLLDTYCAQLNGGTLVIYDGAMPADVSTAITTQKDLATFDLASPAFADATATSTGAEALLETVPSVVANDTGNAVFGRFFDNAGTARLDADCSIASGSGAIKLNAVAVAANVNLAVISFKFTQRKSS